MSDDFEDGNNETGVTCGGVLPWRAALPSRNLRVYPAGELCKHCNCQLSIYNPYDVCDLCIRQNLADYDTQLEFNHRFDRIKKRVFKDLEVRKRKSVRKIANNPRSVREEIA